MNRPNVKQETFPEYHWILKATVLLSIFNDTGEDAVALKSMQQRSTAYVTILPLM